jgi:hypothetical protein
MGGGGTLQLCSRRVGQYVWLIVMTPCVGWWAEWFPIQNSAPSLLAIMGAPPMGKQSWEWGADKGKMSKLEGVLTQVGALIIKGHIEEPFVETFFS